mgnify:CR=1 FL=1
MNTTEKDKQVKVYCKNILNGKERFIWVVPENIYIGNITLKDWKNAVEGQFQALNGEIKRLEEKYNNLQEKLIVLLKGIGGVE